MARPARTAAPVGDQNQGSQTRKIVVSGFTGGLNNSADLTSLNQDEMSILDNFEVDSNGGLTSRPPIVKVEAPPVADRRCDIMGFYTNEVGVIYAVVAVELEGTYLYEPDTATYTKISTVIASGAAQFGDKLYISCATSAGGYWDGLTFTQLNTGSFPMPKGEQITLYKSRFWMISRETASNRERIFFSRITAAGSPPTSINEWNVWDPSTGNDFFDVSAGDGQWISKIVAGSYELFVFRNGSTYVFKYDVSPLSGKLDVIDANIGADNRWSVDRYEFSYIVLNAGRLYRFVSYVYYPLNDPQKLELRPSAGSTNLDVRSAVSVFGRRALVMYGGTIYSLDMTAGVWSTWSSPTTEFGYALRVPRRENDLTPATVYGVTASATDAKHGILRIVDTIQSSAQGTEEMICTARTKAFDFEAPDAWKRMWYWSADVLTARHVVGTAEPLQLSSFQPTWDDLEDYTHDQLEAGTWDQPLTLSGTVITDRPFPSGTPYRVSVTFAKDQRFRRCSYQIEMSTDGSSATGPVRLVSIAVNALVKQRLPQVVQ